MTTRRALRELALVAVLFLAYKAGRLLVADHVEQAVRNAWDVWHLERGLRLPNEVAVQRAMLPAARAANVYYAFVHFPATAGTLVWLYIRRPDHYLWVRRTLAWLTATSLAVHMLMPLAPPRMLGATGMLDTAMLFGPSVYGPPSTDTLANQYAAMPSLHVGWAVVVALAVIVTVRGRYRWLALLHPMITVAVVVATGNHYWLDAIVVVVLLGLVLLLLRPWSEADRHEVAEAARIRALSPHGQRPGPAGREAGHAQRGGAPLTARPGR